MEKTNHLQGRQVSGGGKNYSISLSIYRSNKYSVTNPSA